MTEQVFAILLQTVLPFLLGASGVWFYYRQRFIDVLTELEDKKLIIKTIHQHADEIERENVKSFAREHNAKVAKENVKKTKKPVKKVLKG